VGGEWLFVLLGVDEGWKTFSSVCELVGQPALNEFKDRFGCFEHF
jgi:hypothetical protein